MRLSPKHELYLALNFVSKKNQDATETFMFRARQIHGNRFDYSRSIYKGCNKDIEVICRLHGSFNTTPTMVAQNVLEDTTTMAMQPSIKPNG